MRGIFRLLAVLTVFAAAAFAAASAGALTIGAPVNVTRDTLSQNETPLAVNPANPQMLLSGSNDWNYNDGCGMYVSTNGGKSWSGALPEGYLPGITKYTNDPNVPGTGAYDAGGDPVVAFSPDGQTAYFVCQSFNFTPPYQIQLLLNRGTVTRNGITWQSTGLTPISTWNGNGKTKGGNGQFPDHESIHVDASGRIYVTWAQFDGQGTHSPVLVATSTNGGRSFSTPVRVTAGNIRNNQDQRIITAPDGDAYLTFDNGVQGGKGTVFYASKSTDGGMTWSAPVLFATLVNPVCVFPTYCFNISGGQFRAGGTQLRRRRRISSWASSGLLRPGATTPRSTTGGTPTTCWWTSRTRLVRTAGQPGVMRGSPRRHTTLRPGASRAQVRWAIGRSSATTTGSCPGTTGPG